MTSLKRDRSQKQKRGTQVGSASKITNSQKAITDADSTNSQSCSGACELVETFRQLVLMMDRCIDGAQSKPDNKFIESIDCKRLARAMLLAGGGSRFEPAVMLAIREYRSAFENVRYCLAAEVSEPVRQDLLARFRQQLDSAQQALEILEVATYEPNVSEPVDSKWHRVVRTVSTSDPLSVELIACVLSPGFKWVDDRGEICISHARIEAYVPSKQISHERSCAALRTNPRLKRPANVSLATENAVEVTLHPACNATEGQ